MIKVSPEAFQGWRHVLMGHYHLAQFLDERMQYVGSPYQINFSEANHIPHILILDLETMSIEYIENKFSPRHLIVKENQLGEIDMVNNFVQVIGDLTKFDAFEIKKSVTEEKARTIEFRAFRLKETIEAGSAKDKFNLGEGRTLERYVDAVGTNGLERDMLIQTALEVVDECSEFNADLLINVLRNEPELPLYLGFCVSEICGDKDPQLKTYEVTDPAYRRQLIRFTPPQKMFIGLQQDVQFPDVVTMATSNTFCSI